MKTAYVEVGKNCFCNCVPCNTWRNPHTEVSRETFERRASILKNAGFERFHLTGNDPVTADDFQFMTLYMGHNDIKLDITTTLLDTCTVRNVAEAYKLRVSLMGCFSRYARHHRVDRTKFSKLVRNLQLLSSVRSDVTIFNYTLMNSNTSVDDARGIVDMMYMLPYLNYTFQFFPAMGRENDRFTFRDFFETLNLYGIKYEFTEAKYRKRRSCTVMDKRLYIKGNGDVYPCCMAGGEVGQDIQPELKLGNIDMDSIYDMMDEHLTDLDNPICNKCTPKYWSLM